MLAHAVELLQRAFGHARELLRKCVDLVVLQRGNRGHLLRQALLELSELLAKHKGQTDWTETLVKTKDFIGQYISMGPGKKTKTVFYADDRVFWFIQAGKIRFNIEGQKPFIATKGFMVEVPFRIPYSMETVGNEPSLRFEARPPNLEGRGRVDIRDLVRNALRMRPDRIVVGECRAGEAFDMLAAMNTGHEGSLTTLHANSPRDALARLETMILMAGMDLPLPAIRDHVASSIDIIVHVHLETTPLADGTAQRSRWVAEILTLTPGERDKGYAVQQVFLAPNGGRKAEPRVLPDEYRDLAAWGFALEEFYGQSEAAS